MEQDDTLHDRSVLLVRNIIELLGFCLHSTYLSFQDKFYEQVEGVAMESPVSPIVANLYIEHFEREALRSASIPPGFGLALCHSAAGHKQLFLDHINSVDPAIKFTVDGNQENGAIPFINTLVMPKADNSLSITVYQKPTHTDQYLQWESHHNLSAKYNVKDTLTHRAKTVCTEPELLNEELQQLREALVRCKYPRWAINKIQNTFINNNLEGDGDNNTQAGNNTTQASNNSGDSSEDRPLPRGRPKVGHIVIPYIQGLGESIKNMCTKYGIQTCFKGNKTLRHVLVKPKDQDPKEKKSGVIYS